MSDLKEAVQDAPTSVTLPLEGPNITATSGKITDEARRLQAAYAKKPHKIPEQYTFSTPPMDADELRSFFTDRYGE